MKITRISEVQEEPAASPLFTGGVVTRQAIVPPELGLDINCAIVNFGRGSRNKFHAHTSDQILIITSGIGIVATAHEERQVTVGDVVHIPAGEKHWHGGRKESPMAHITVTGRDSKTTQIEE